MKLRFAADWRTLVWAFVLLPAVSLAPYVSPAVLGWTVPLALYTGLCAGILAHNQNHCPVFESRTANAAYPAWLSVLYAYPVFAWIPTHNQNHHKFLNRPGDATITWRCSKKNTWLVASTYFFVSVYWQRPVVAAFVRRARAAAPRLHRQIRLQTATVVGAHLALLLLAVALRGPRLGALVYLGGFGVSAAAALWGSIFVNYVQHVHCDPWSAHDHSRNFVSPLGNWLTFNNGLHTAHHEHPGVHWSELRALHARLAPRIAPELRPPSLLGFCVRAYLLGFFFGRFRTRQIGRAAYDVPLAAA